MSILEDVRNIQKSLNQYILDQEDIIEKVILSLLCSGNILLEGAPGTGKTRTIKSLASLLDSSLGRIQFTPDLLPSDIVGSEVYLSDEAGNGRLEFSKGPIFNNLILADEVNRSPAKVQSALLEAMEERQVTVSGKTYELSKLFMVMATQNPIEQEGTYPLPEAQLDRFLFKLILNYPSKEAEKMVMKLVRSEDHSKKVEEKRYSQETIFSAREEIKSIYSSDSIDQYIVDLVEATRNPSSISNDMARWIEMGVSPRATISLDRASRAKAWLSGEDHVEPDHVRSVFKEVLRHRLYLSYEASAEGVDADRALSNIMEVVKVL